MKVLLPTKNKVKIKKWGTLIRDLGYELVTLNDFNMEFEEPKEDGKSVLENALKKAKYYYWKTKIVTVATDSSLYIDGLPTEEQYGLFAGRRVIRDENGQIIGEEKLTDEANYQRLKTTIESLGGEAKGYFQEGIVIYYGEGAFEWKEFKMNRFFKAPGSDVKETNAPMRSFTYYPELDKYRSEMTNDEANAAEGEVFECQREFFRRSLSVVDGLMDHNFQLLLNRVLECRIGIYREGLKRSLEEIKDACICIGSGGSAAASLFSSLVLKEKNGIITNHMGTRDLLYETLSLYKNVFAVTYENKNYGIDSALSKARDNGLNTYILTNSRLVKANSNGLDHMLIYDSFFPKEYSFVSMASTFMPMKMMLMYYLDARNENDVNEFINTVYKRAKNEEHEVNGSSEVFEISTGDNTYVAARVLKSSIAESGIGTPTDFSKYDDYCHGLTNLSYVNPNHTLIHLINGKPTELDNLLLEVAKNYSNVLVLQSHEQDRILGEFDLAMKALFLCGEIARSKGRDISKFGYSPAVQKVYRFRGEM